MLEAAVFPLGGAGDEHSILGCIVGEHRLEVAVQAGGMRLIEQVHVTDGNFAAAERYRWGRVPEARCSAIDDQRFLDADRVKSPTGEMQAARIDGVDLVAND